MLGFHLCPECGWPYFSWNGRLGPAYFFFWLSPCDDDCKVSVWAYYEVNERLYVFPYLIILRRSWHTDRWEWDIRFVDAESYVDIFQEDETKGD